MNHMVLNAKKNVVCQEIVESGPCLEKAILKIKFFWKKCAKLELLPKKGLPKVFCKSLSRMASAANKRQSLAWNGF